MGYFKDLKGVLYVGIGACSYGVLATFVKYANEDGYGMAGLIFAQYLVGAVALSLLAFFQRTISISRQRPEKNSKLKLILFGTSLGLTSTFYYLSIQHIPVSVGVVLLMQTVWMGVVLEFILARHLVTAKKIAGAVLALAGTLLAAKVFESEFVLNPTGVIYGLLAAMSYTATMYASNNIGLELTSIARSKYLVYGGFLIVLIFWNISIIDQVSWPVIWKWGCFLGFFGTILPPLLFARGFPKTGTGLGSIIAALEIPVSVYSAHLVLHERISILQWAGITIILAAVFLINLRQLKAQKLT